MPKYFPNNNTTTTTTTTFSIVFYVYIPKDHTIQWIHYSSRHFCWPDIWDGVEFQGHYDNHTNVIPYRNFMPRRMIPEVKQFFDHFSSFHRVYIYIYIYFLSLIKHRIITTITIFLFSYRKMLKRLLIISRHDTRWSLESYGEENCRGHYRKLICFATHPPAIRLYPLTRSFTDVYYRSKFVDSLTYFMEFVLHT